MDNDRPKVLQFPADQEAKKILVVEDEVLYRELWTRFLEVEGYVVEIAGDGREALAMARSMAPDLVLLEVVLPDMTGFEVAGVLRADPVTETAPIIMITSNGDRESKLLGLEAGAHDFLVKPFDRVELVVRIRNLLRLKYHVDAFDKFSQVLVEKMDERTRDLRDSQREALWILMRAIESRDGGPTGHAQRVSLEAAVMADQLGLDRDFRDRLLYAAALHDIGNIAIPDSIVAKEGRLDADELDVVRSHCVVGARILGEGTSPYMKMGTEIALNHHENWDGSGYPSGLSGNNIPLPARIVHLVDVYEGLRHHRAYRPAFDHDAAVRAITDGYGDIQPRHFDPAIVAAFHEARTRIAQIHNDHG